ncbi:MAG: sel1 repeat family protein [Atopobiaceae bacterium]|nr:sel1 repeat family protein [Atopobiaceae bacterium]
MTNWHGNGGGWGADAPVFDWDWPTAADGGSSDRSYGLPVVWTTVQQHEPTDTSTGRNCIWRYDPADDPDSDQALAYGSDYYNEGMSCDPMTEHERRIMCFQAAELLYLHASRKGNPIGDLNLGYVYSYDRCEGRYWNRGAASDAPVTAEEIAAALEGRRAPFDHEAHAYEHFRKAAEADVAEACYKLGDLLREGRGCDTDMEEAFEWFSRAYALGRDEHPVIWGSAALRLGRAYEEGEGCM